MTARRPTAEEWADLAARVAALEKLAKDALTGWVPEDPETRVRTLHGFLWATLAPSASEGAPPTVTPLRAVEIWAANKRFHSAPTAETYLTQMCGLELAANLSTTTEGQRIIRQWGILPPPPATARVLKRDRSR